MQGTNAFLAFGGLMSLIDDIKIFNLLLYQQFFLKVALSETTISDKIFLSINIFLEFIPLINFE